MPVKNKGPFRVWSHPEGDTTKHAIYEDSETEAGPTSTVVLDGIYSKLGADALCSLLNREANILALKEKD